MTSEAFIQQTTYYEHGKDKRMNLAIAERPVAAQYHRTYIFA